MHSPLTGMTFEITLDKCIHEKLRSHIWGGKCIESRFLVIPTKNIKGIHNLYQRCINDANKEQLSGIWTNNYQNYTSMKLTVVLSLYSGEATAGNTVSADNNEKISSESEFKFTEAERPNRTCY